MSDKVRVTYDALDAGVYGREFDSVSLLLRAALAQAIVDLGSRDVTFFSYPAATVRRTTTTTPEPKPPLVVKEFI